ncbi:glycosyl transferase family 2 [Methanobacterium lacus]|uniref:Glycosyl transferase family 2 n=1 Tax=Methanobacterium lacus (strain AL-21) TaxID=877455 RepID=F0TAV0_METLA|nr:glycosyltransferase family A protein [Methanobacterium lacus]ADZ08976.1 glycosyl transferase family 2 [Methanobacterium lacus]
MEKKYDLTVAYRIYPKISCTPAIYGDDKYKLSEFCLKSFKESLGNLKVKMIVLLDGCPPKYRELFLKYFDESDIDFFELDKIGNLPTFSLQINLLLKQNYSEIIYFAEDDYYYHPNQFFEMIDFFNKNDDVDFITPYDHSDYYNRNIHNIKRYERMYNGRQWKTASSTCLTFLTSKKILDETQNIFLTYQKGNTDLGLWLSLTKSSLDPKIIIKSLNIYTIKSLYKTFVLTQDQIHNGKTWKLWFPIPTIATHLEKEFISPTINWENIVSKELNK